MLGGAGVAEAGADLGEVRVGIAGMADELPDSVGLGHGGEQAAEGGGRVRDAGGEDADGTFGGGEAGSADEAAEVSAMHVERGDGEVAETGCGGRGAAGPGWLKGVANGGDATGAGGAEQRSQDPGKDVGVLVGVDVGDTEAGSLEAANLRSGFGFDFGGADAAGVEVDGEAAEAGAQGLAVGAEGGNLRGRQRGDGVDEENVAADFKGGVGLGDGDGFDKKRGGSHEGRGGKRVALVEFSDGAIDAGGEAEVVGVDDEGHEEQGTGSRF